MTGNSRHLSRRSINALIAGAAAWPCSGAALPISLQHPKDFFYSRSPVRITIGSAYLESLPPTPGRPTPYKYDHLRTECEAER